MNWHSTFGEISVLEQVYRDREGKLQRPFAGVAAVRCRGYSRPLQRVITDFGADVAFGRVAEKLKEHYGIRIPQGAAAERHARALSEAQIIPPPTGMAVQTLIAEIDGSMVPVVQTAPPAAGNTGKPADRRRHRQLARKKARLSLVRPFGAVEPTYAVTLGDTGTAGGQIKSLAVAAGLAPRTRVHGAGDGTPWIAEQMERQFGAQGSCLIDFYHLCDYLATAAPACVQAPEEPQAWLARQKEHLKAGGMAAVMAALEARLEPEAAAETPVRDCFRYIANRPGQFNYPAAISAKLPIGSDEVESAHRYVIQKRLKLPGAWWRADNAQAMLNLRSLRANHQWHRYWTALAA